MAANPNGSEVPPISKAPFQIPAPIFDAELEAIRARRRAVGLMPPAETQEDVEPNRKTEQPEIKDKLVGLALSGGGIRSATFSLGVMQRLAKEGCLEYVDYLSTVSGGGYIGGSLTWLLSAAAGKHKGAGAFGTSSTNFPYGVENPREKRLRGEDESNILRHLRLHGKYLTPGKGITTTSLIAVILRGILLNFVVWLPLLVALMVVLLFTCYAFVHHSWDAIRNVTADTQNRGDGFDLLLYAAGLMAIAFLGLSVLYSIATRIRIEKGRYRLRRCFEEWIRWPLWFGLFFGVLGSLPAAERWLEGYVKEAGTASLLLGVVGGLWSFARSGSKGNGKIPLAVLAPLASILFFYGLALASYGLALLYFEVAWFKWVLLAGVVSSLVTGLFVNLNYISIHRYYRDRLMEAFMPAPDTDGTTGPAEGANKAKLSDMWRSEAAHAPYHLVNTNVVLVDSDDRRWRVRGGDSFLLSPKYCGSTATGWAPTTDYMKRDPLTLATAVAISGAAANPNTGVGGTGPTRNPVLSLLMSLLNVRLGYWVPHPGKRLRVANHFHAAYRELSSYGYEENQRLLQLSDGGHFENLAVYELVRRRVKLIICCDGGADPEFSFSDLQILVRRIGADFGAWIDFDVDNHLERIIPREPVPEKVRARDPRTDAYPGGAKFAERGYIKGTISYPGTDAKSTLILLKTTMIQRLGLTLKGYKGAHPTFPDESTGDQFFDEEQFEAYRELGYEIAERMIPDPSVGLKALLDDCA